MIYIIIGNDINKRNSYIKNISSSGQIVKLTNSSLSPEALSNYALSSSLFGDRLTYIIDGVLSLGDIDLSKEILLTLKNSSTQFIFLEDKLLAKDENKYKKYAIIENFTIKASKAVPKINIFNITDAFARRDKVEAWRLYSNAIESGIEPESIAGILFWKIKTMILNNSKIFSRQELITQSSSVVSIYHMAHRGELDFSVALEQFILSSLSK